MLEINRSIKQSIRNFMLYMSIPSTWGELFPTNLGIKKRILKLMDLEINMSKCHEHKNMIKYLRQVIKLFMKIKKGHKTIKQ